MRGSKASPLLYRQGSGVHDLGRKRIRDPLYAAKREREREAGGADVSLTVHSLPRLFRRPLRTITRGRSCSCRCSACSQLRTGGSRSHGSTQKSSISRHEAKLPLRLILNANSLMTKGASRKSLSTGAATVEFRFDDHKTVHLARKCPFVPFGVQG